MAGRTHAKRPSRAELRERALAAASAVGVPAARDVVVAGGGASGLVAAIAAAEAGARTCVLEQDLECGRKILATGNGRCNFANEDLDPARYRNGAFVAKVAGARWLEEILGFFAASGLAWASEEGRLYPLSRQAASVRSVLLARARRAGVTLAPARKVTSVAPAAGAWKVSFSPAAPGEKGAPQAGGITARALIVASGGASKLAGGLGLPAVAEEPVLCALACAPLPFGAGVPDGRTDTCNAALDLQLVDGRRARAHATLLRAGRELWGEDGEVLFRPWGLSGICVFDLSRRAQAGDVVALDLTCGLTKGELGAAAATGTADGVLDPQLSCALGAAPGNDASALLALRRARDLRFSVTGRTETERAQVTRGGLDVAGFCPKTLECATLPGLFACGEALDVDADCGGFNLAWAWRSGQVAGASAAALALSQNRK